MKSQEQGTESSSERSLPSWERGLKLLIIIVVVREQMSLPSWERGLKSVQESSKKREELVAPLVGAWIEITTVVCLAGISYRRSPRGSVD